MEKRRRGENKEGSKMPGGVQVLALLMSMCRVSGSYLAFHRLTEASSRRREFPEPLFLVFALGMTSVITLALQKPWIGRKLPRHRWQKMVIAGAYQAAMMCAWMAGLRACGPVRAFLVEGAELPLLYFFSVLTQREKSHKTKTRGALLMIMGYGLLFYDASGKATVHVQQLGRSSFGVKTEKALGGLKNRTENRLQQLAAHSLGKSEKIGLTSHERRHRKIPAPLDDDALPVGGRRRLLVHDDRRLDVDGAASGDEELRGEVGKARHPIFASDSLRSEVGVGLLLLTAVINQATKSFSRRLATDIGGAKRYFALSTTFATISILPWAGGSLYVLREEVSVLLDKASIIKSCAGGLLLILLPFYMQSLLGSRLSARALMRVGFALPVVIAFIVSRVEYFGERAGISSGICSVVFVCEALGLTIMTASDSKTNKSDLPLTRQE